MAGRIGRTGLAGRFALSSFEQFVRLGKHLGSCCDDFFFLHQRVLAARLDQLLVGWQGLLADMDNVQRHVGKLGKQGQCVRQAVRRAVVLAVGDDHNVVLVLLVVNLLSHQEDGVVQRRAALGKDAIHQNRQLGLAPQLFHDARLELPERLGVKRHHSKPVIVFHGVKARSSSLLG